MTRFNQKKYYFLFPILHPKQYKTVKTFRNNICHYGTTSNVFLQDLVSKHNLVFSYSELVAVKSKCYFTKREISVIDSDYSNRLNMVEIVENLGDSDQIDWNITMQATCR